MVSFSNCNYIDVGAFDNCSQLMSIILLTSEVPSLYDTILKSEYWHLFNNTPITDPALTGHYGSIYVWDNRVEDFKEHPRWSMYADRITSYVFPV